MFSKIPVNPWAFYSHDKNNSSPMSCSVNLTLILLPLTLLVSPSHTDLHMERGSFSMITQTLLSQDGKTLDPRIATEFGENITLLYITAYDLTIPNTLLR